MQKHLSQAATRLAEAWQHDRHLSQLEPDLQPKNRREAYAVQALIVDQINEPTIGWKIAATSEGGQRHINVSAPLAGRLFASRVLPDGASLNISGNRMLVAEAEFGFRFGKAIPARANHGHDDSMSMETMLDAVTDMVLAIELPDSRFENFVAAGEAQLIADFACARHFILGPTVSADWRSRDLSKHPVRFRVNEHIVAEGSGAFVLGDPRAALHWLVRELGEHRINIEAGDVMFTGTCVIPVPIKPGDKLCADFADFGQVTAHVI